MPLPYQLRSSGRVPYIQQHRRRAQHHRHHQPVHEAGLVGHGRRHEHHVIAVQSQPFCIGVDVGHQGIGRVHDALGLTRGAAGIDELCDGIGLYPVLFQNMRRIGTLFPRGLGKQGLKAVRTRSTNGRDVLQVRQLRLNAFEHGLVIHIAKVLEHDDHLSFTVAEHEQQLALAEDRHQGIEHSTNARACQVQHRELPDIGQLAGHHIGGPHTQTPQPHRYTVGHASQLCIAKWLRSLFTSALPYQRQPVGPLACCVVQGIVDGGVPPPALASHLRAARCQQYGIKLHVCLLSVMD
ncbi:hypothetical protein D3C72_1383580 [compost metagenome]